MPYLTNSNRTKERLAPYVADCRANLVIDERLLPGRDIKAGLRNADGTGVLAGATMISDVHGYVLKDGVKIPDEGRLFYRGIDVRDIVAGCGGEDRFGFEEVVWLLLFGYLPDRAKLDGFAKLLWEMRELPDGFVEDMLIKAPSPDIMNKLGRSVLALYSYDNDADILSLENIFRQSIELIARVSTIAVDAYQVKKRYYDHSTLFFHPPAPELSVAENILSTLRMDRNFTREEAMLLDTCLILHAEHGGGNNSTFALRVASSSGTDTYAAVAAALGSLKGPKHGGANKKTTEMLDYIKAGVKDYSDDEEIKSFLKDILAKKSGDGSGLIYGMGHAVYTKSDPRAVILKENAKKLAVSAGYGDDFTILDAIERLSPELLAVNGKKQPGAICANLDLYSGLVYRVLGIPPELFTPVFAVARMAGWCAHRIEEVFTCNKIMRPAYLMLNNNNKYIKLSDR